MIRIGPLEIHFPTDPLPGIVILLIIGACAAPPLAILAFMWLGRMIWK